MKKIASISIDMDREIDYGNIYGESMQQTKEYLYKESLPRILDLLRSFQIHATFFIVGHDLTIPRRRNILKQILKEGHELANHTYSHPQNFLDLTVQQQRDEIEKTHQLFWTELKYRCVGFRAPGYNINHSVINILQSLGYTYDSSVHPTILHPLMRLALFVKTRRIEGLQSMGPWQVMAAPTNPFWYTNNINKHNEVNPQILEIPISVLPIFRLPTFGTIDLFFGKNYFKLTRHLRNTSPMINYEIHGIDLVNKPKESFAWFLRHPNMKTSQKKRTELYKTIFASLASHRKMLKLCDIASALKK